MKLLNFSPSITWSLFVLGAVFLLNVWHRHHLATLTPKEREEEDKEMEYDMQQW